MSLSAQSAQQHNHHRSPNFNTTIAQSASYELKRPASRVELPEKLATKFTFDAPELRQSKRAFDLILCIIASPLLVCLFAIISAAIWLEDGANPFFFQMRTGLGGKRFRMFKFRTMVPDAEEKKQELQHLNELEWPDFKIKNDPRITRVGKFLRCSSLDELPQIINILLGDMSLVGPRPTSFSAETYKPWHMARLNAVPGLTGLWQVSGRSNLEFDERVLLDIEYIENQSLWTDFKLICRTFTTACIKQEGAY